MEQEKQQSQFAQPSDKPSIDLPDDNKQLQIRKPKLEETWILNESLLQSYRSILYTIQSIWIGIVAIDNLHHLKFFICMAGIAFLSLILSAIWARARTVDFYKFDLFDSKDLNSDSFEGRLNTYVKNSKIRHDVNQLIPGKKKSNWRETRVILDIIIPLGFLLVWLLIIFG